MALHGLSAIQHLLLAKRPTLLHFLAQADGIDLDITTTIASWRTAALVGTKQGGGDPFAAVTSSPSLVVQHDLLTAALSMLSQHDTGPEARLLLQKCLMVLAKLECPDGSLRFPPLSKPIMHQVRKTDLPPDAEEWKDPLQEPPLSLCSLPFLHSTHLYYALMAHDIPLVRWWVQQGHIGSWFYTAPLFLDGNHRETGLEKIMSRFAPYLYSKAMITALAQHAAWKPNTRVRTADLEYQHPRSTLLHFVCSSDVPDMIDDWLDTCPDDVCGVLRSEQAFLESKVEAVLEGREDLRALASTFTVLCTATGKNAARARDGLLGLAYDGAGPRGIGRLHPSPPGESSTVTIHTHLSVAVQHGHSSVIELWRQQGLLTQDLLLPPPVPGEMIAYKLFQGNFDEQKARPGIQILIKAGLLIPYDRPDHPTFFHYACKQGWAAEVRLYLEHQLPYVTDLVSRVPTGEADEHFSALLECALELEKSSEMEGRRLLCAKILACAESIASLPSFVPSTVLPDGWPYLRLACQAGMVRMVKLWISTGLVAGTSLGSACFGYACTQRQNTFAPSTRSNIRQCILALAEAGMVGPSSLVEVPSRYEDGEPKQRAALSIAPHSCLEYWFKHAPIECVRLVEGRAQEGEGSSASQPPLLSFRHRRAVVCKTSLRMRKSLRNHAKCLPQGEARAAVECLAAYDVRMLTPPSPENKALLWPAGSAMKVKLSSPSPAADADNDSSDAHLSDF